MREHNTLYRYVVSYNLYVPTVFDVFNKVKPEWNIYFLILNVLIKWNLIVSYFNEKMPWTLPFVSSFPHWKCALHASLYLSYRLGLFGMPSGHCISFWTFTSLICSCHIRLNDNHYFIIYFFSRSYHSVRSSIVHLNQYQYWK